ncbi:metallophosphoesterase family protein [Phorcysia thermohydrogeniphila]|uniref:DNA repair exonuclease SbcCD nuclease subunit n=1 Tax=Phorcysia thermohydrogeniphila TaxID=936138 RepID=A0A4R1GEJ1_9BACT|nr:exonuclease SbcCD subunit D [Phorcysia thermohydrogeniphila]TCK05263.1 DNA repair exonuclease SbcCD nuclease subunit [Phorcysia thermohydrogeniphila]
MKVAHISDTHLGYMQYRLPERKQDFMLAFERAIDICIEEGVDIILHTGDLFETYQPDMVTLSRCIRTLQKVKAHGIEFIAITGNHDRALRRGTIPPQRILEDLGILKLLNYRPGAPAEELVLSLDGVLIAGFQYFPRRMIKVLKEGFFDELSELAFKATTSILMFHQGIGQYLPYEESFEMELMELPEGFDYYAGGHIHTFVKENLKGGLFSYSGATEFRTVKEAERGKRGFNIFDTDRRELKRIELENLRPFKVARFSEERAKETLEEVLQFVSLAEQPPVVVIDYEYKSLEIETLSKTLEEIEKQSLLLRITKRRITSESNDVTSPGKTFSEFLEEFLREQNHGDKVINLAKEVLTANPDHIQEILKEFVKKELKENLGEIKSFLE